MPECVATSLMEGMVKESKDPLYMEHIVKWALGSMYTGELLVPGLSLIDTY